MGQFSQSWIAIDRSKRGPASHKAFLTREGKNLFMIEEKNKSKMQKFQQINFESQNLKVDFITLTSESKQFQKNVNNIASYFHTVWKFNSFLSNGNQRKIVETLFQDPETKDTLIIRTNYWNKTVFEFPGSSANKLYQLLKSDKISLDFLDFNSLKETWNKS